MGDKGSNNHFGWIRFCLHRSCWHCFLQWAWGCTTWASELGKFDLIWMELYFLTWSATHIENLHLQKFEVFGLLVCWLILLSGWCNQNRQLTMGIPYFLDMTYGGFCDARVWMFWWWLQPPVLMIMIIVINNNHC